MVGICLYFQVHQPLRLKHYTVFDIGSSHDYFDDEKNKEIVLKVAKKCYLPMNALLLKLLKKHKGTFKVSFSITGTALEQFSLYCPEVIDSFKQLVETGFVELLQETDFHSLSSLYSPAEFKEQVQAHGEKIKSIFGITPTTFRNTELIYNNEIAQQVEEMGFKTILTEGADHILGWKSPNYMYQAHTTNLKLLLKNYKLSDDIAFRFSNKNWSEFPLSVDKYTKWISSSTGDLINLFMDYETFGEHQWEETGIFTFMEHLPQDCIDAGHVFITPQEASSQFTIKDVLDIKDPISWADTDRDISAWIGNQLQQNALKELYAIESLVKATKDAQLLHDWRALTTSDHVYYMSTKWFEDGDVHSYFSPFDSPYDAFIAFMNVINDIIVRCKDFDATAALATKLSAEKKKTTEI